MNKEKIGVIGFGKMGYGMGKNLLKGGYGVNVYDISSERVEQARNMGATVFDSAREAGENSDYALIMVYPSSAAYDVVFNDGLAEGLKRKSENTGPKPIIIDGNNADYNDSLKIYKELKLQGIDYLDVGFSGGPAGAEEGTLAAMIGGDKEVYERAKPILVPMCKTIDYLGDAGNGHFTKVNLHNGMEYNIMSGITEIAALASHKSNGDYVPMMSAVNNGLSQNNLLSILIKIDPSLVPLTGPQVDYTQNAAERALEDAKKYGIGMPVTLLSVAKREMSHELAKNGLISRETRDKLYRSLDDQFNLMEGEFRRTGAVASLSMESLLRNAFGGHKTYPTKKR